MDPERTSLLPDGTRPSSQSIRGMRIVIRVRLSSRFPRFATLLPFQGLEYSVPSNVERGKLAYLLRNVSGFFNPGQMSCLVRTEIDSVCSFDHALTDRPQRKWQDNADGHLGRTQDARKDHWDPSLRQPATDQNLPEEIYWIRGAV